MGEKRAIVMPSVGRRPWSRFTSDNFRRYAEKCEADFFLVEHLPPPSEFPLPSLPQRPGRKNKAAYASKAFWPWKFITVDGYDKVLVVDDSCCVRYFAPDIFLEAKEHHLTFTGSSLSSAKSSFEFIDNYTSEQRLDKVEHNAEHYMNSGVMVYDKHVVDAFSPSKVVAYNGLLMSKHPHQTLTYYLMKIAGIKPHKIDKKFNTVPAMNLPRNYRAMLESVADLIDGSVFIHHITGVFKNRFEVISELARLFNQEWDSPIEEPRVSGDF